MDYTRAATLCFWKTPNTCASAYDMYRHDGDASGQILALLLAQLRQHAAPTRRNGLDARRALATEAATRLRECAIADMRDAHSSSMCVCAR
eukprot:6197073-Pleurochrysis_carterae.AAC.1